MAKGIGLRKEEPEGCLHATVEDTSDEDKFTEEEYDFNYGTSALQSYDTVICREPIEDLGSQDGSP